MVATNRTPAWRYFCIRERDRAQRLQCAVGANGDRRSGAGWHAQRPAYEAYLQGRALYNLAKDEATDRQAKADYEIAIAADPNFALAHAALSRSLSSIAAAYAKAAELKGIYPSDR